MGENYRRLRTKPGFAGSLLFSSSMGWTQGKHKWKVLIKDRDMYAGITVGIIGETPYLALRDDVSIWCKDILLAYGYYSDYLQPNPNDGFYMSKLGNSSLLRECQGFPKG